MLFHSRWCIHWPFVLKCDAFWKLPNQIFFLSKNKIVLFGNSNKFVRCRFSHSNYEKDCVEQRIRCFFGMPSTATYSVMMLICDVKIQFFDFLHHSTLTTHIAAWCKCEHYPINSCCSIGVWSREFLATCQFQSGKECKSFATFSKTKILYARMDICSAYVCSLRFFESTMNLRVKFDASMRQNITSNFQKYSSKFILFR